MATLFSTLVSLGFIALVLWAILEVVSTLPMCHFKVLWILLLLFLPLIGLIIWALAGPRRVKPALTPSVEASCAAPSCAAISAAGQRHDHCQRSTHGVTLQAILVELVDTYGWRPGPAH